MDHAPAVGEADRLADLGKDLKQPRPVGGLELVGQGLPGDELHGQERRAVGQRSQGVHRRDARMRQPARDLRLPDEPVGAGAGQQGLESDLAVEAQVHRGEDPAHAAARDLAQHAVAGDRNRWRISRRLCDRQLRASGRDARSGVHLDCRTRARYGHRLQDWAVRIRGIRIDERQIGSDARGSFGARGPCDRIITETAIDGVVWVQGRHGSRSFEHAREAGGAPCGGHMHLGCLVSVQGRRRNAGPTAAVRAVPSDAISDRSQCTIAGGL